jgi:hypothetical protein
LPAPTISHLDGQKGLISIPFEITTTKVLQPRHADRRIIVQAGLFTVHERTPESTVTNGFVPLETSAEYRPLLSKLLITERMLPKIRGELDRSGIHSASMFPDLPGLCRHIASQSSLLADEPLLVHQHRP